MPLSDGSQLELLVHAFQTFRGDETGSVLSQYYESYCGNTVISLSNYQRLKNISDLYHCDTVKHLAGI